MTPAIALTVTLVFIFYLFKRDFHEPYRPSHALWVPSIWLLLLGSRPLSYWLDLGLTSQDAFQSQAAGDYMEGSPIDRAGFLILMAAGLIVLFKRSIAWRQVLQNNIAIALFFLYCAITVLWSDFPEVASKRWCKSLGDPMMVLIILSDPQPIKAVRAVLKRCTYILIPLSVLFIKYYSHLGREYSEHEGLVFYTGVAMNKNVLGFICMACGLFCVWRLCAEWSERRATAKNGDAAVAVLLLAMVGWLFYMTDSKTSLLCLMIGSLIMVGLGAKHVRENTGRYLIIGIFVLSILQLVFNVGELIILGAGRDTTLTGRTELWEIVLGMAEHPLTGDGYESFWLGDRLKKLWAIYYFKPNQAHSGYIETYLNLGLIGVAFLTGMIISLYRKMRELLSGDASATEQVNFARYGLGFLAAYLFFNITEAAFKELHFLFVTFLIFAMKYPPSVHRPRLAGRAEAVASAPEQLPSVISSSHGGSLARQ